VTHAHLDEPKLELRRQGGRHGGKATTIVRRLKPRGRSPGVSPRELSQNALLADSTNLGTARKRLDDHAATEGSSRTCQGAQIRAEIRLFAMLAQIESGVLLRQVCPRADRSLHESKNAQRAERGDGDRSNNSEQLNSHLPGIPRKQAVAAGGVHEFRGEHAGQQGARDSGHAVAGEHVERVVELRAGPNLDSRIADAGREHTDREPGQRGYVSSGRRDADETDDETGCRADRRDLAGAYQVE